MNSNGLKTNGDHRKLFPVIPDDVKKIWNVWALPGLMIIILTFQIIFMLGNRRRYYQRARYRIPLWYAYSLKYSVASTALGILTQTALGSCSISKTNELMSFWGSFIFLHLCGPDTITAYSLEDNKLWFRRLGELLIPSCLAVYILLLSLPGCSHLPLLSIFVYIAAYIKLFERVQSLRLANKEHIRESISCPVESSPLPVDHSVISCTLSLVAHILFQESKSLLADLPREDTGNAIFSDQHTADEAFEVVDTALGYGYDHFYTNRSRLYTIKGHLLHAVGVLLVPLVGAGFYFLCDMDDYQAIHVAITFLLFSEVGLKEIFAVITMLQSDWTELLLSRRNLTRDILIFPFLKQPRKKRWSNSISQLDLLSVAMEAMPPARFLPLQKYFGLDKHLEKHRYRSYIEVPGLLKYLIHKQFWDTIKHSSDPKALYIHKGRLSLERNRCCTLLWSIDKVEFVESILIWHIATALCYYSKAVDQVEIHRKASKIVSEYLMNLVVSNPELLPKGFGMDKYCETCAEVKDILKSPIAGKALACQKLLAFNWTEMPTTDQCKSVLFQGCKLALALRDMDDKQMWQVTTQVWIEMLAYAAAHCTGVHHCQQLRKGGEFLTHVWLIMVGLGISSSSARIGAMCP